MRNKTILWYSCNKKRKYLFIKIIANSMLTGYDLDKTPFVSNDGTPCYQIFTNTDNILHITTSDFAELCVEIQEKMNALTMQERYSMLWSNDYKRLL